MPGLFPVFVVVILVFVGLSLIWNHGRSTGMIQRWAADNGYQVTDAESRWLRRGPYFFRCSRGQTVYYVTLTDSAGQIHHAYIRCGGYWGGLFSDKVAVEWVD